MTEIAPLSAATTIQSRAASPMGLLQRPGRSPARRHAAVDHQLLAGDVVAGVGAQEEHAVGDVLCLAPRGSGTVAAARSRGSIGALRRLPSAPVGIFSQIGVAMMPGCTELQRMLSAMFERHRLGEQTHAALGRRIGREARHRAGRHRGHQHDRAAARALHRRDQIAIERNTPSRLMACAWRCQSASVIVAIGDMMPMPALATMMSRRP